MEKKIHPLGYWNSNGVAVAIVAIANYAEGELFDWAAFIGGTTRTWNEEDAYDDVAEYGLKLDVNAACYFAKRNAYPFLVKECYRG